MIDFSHSSPTVKFVHTGGRPNHDACAAMRVSFVDDGSRVPIKWRQRANTMSALMMPSIVEVLDVCEARGESTPSLASSFIDRSSIVPNKCNNVLLERASFTAATQDTLCRSIVHCQT